MRYYDRYIKRSLRAKDIGDYRLVLVQGTMRGRLHSIRLHPLSEVIPLTVNTEENETPKYEIHISGTDESKMLTILGSQEVKWQLSFPSEAVQQDWLVALKNARTFSKNWHEDETNRLTILMKKMRNNVDARRRLFRFKLLPRCFIGRRAVRFITEYEGCTKSQAVVIGQKMLNLGLIQHISNEHVFCNKKLFYQFPMLESISDRINISHRLSSTSVSSREARAEKNEEVERMGRALIEKMSMNAEELKQVNFVLPLVGGQKKL